LTVSCSSYVVSRVSSALGTAQTNPSFPLLSDFRCWRLSVSYPLTFLLLGIYNPGTVGKVTSESSQIPTTKPTLTFLPQSGAVDPSLWPHTLWTIIAPIALDKYFHSDFPIKLSALVERILSRTQKCMLFFFFLRCGVWTQGPKIAGWTLLLLEPFCQQNSKI
jgi:hypothetical protein